MTKYILVLLNGSLFVDLLMDLEKSKNVYTYIMNKNSGNKMIDFIRRVYTSPRAAQYIHLPFKGMWYQSIQDQIGDRTYIIFTTETIIRLDLCFLRDIKNRHPLCKLILLVMDSMHAHSMHMKYARTKITEFQWDLVLSFDKEDCKEYGFSYLGGKFYSRRTDIARSCHISDLYYIGYDVGGRTDTLIHMYDFMKKNGVICHFNVVGKSHLKSKGIVFAKKIIPYHNIISDLQGTNCILEILQEGQTAQTVRYYEAVCYNKKLLTNNPNLESLPFYDPRYMKYFKDFNDVNTQWVKRREHIDYSYEDEFSPLHLKDILRSHFD
jgi:hypothetical protein